MRLTVGPLPAAVYWRRRLLVLGALVLVVVAIVYACTSGPSGAGSDPLTQPTSSPSPSSPRVSPTPTPSPTPSPTPTPTAFTLPVAAATGPCTDDEIELTASANPSTLTVGQTATFTLRIKNISTRSCVRNIGSIPQELQLLRADGTIAWSSDDCRDSAVYGPDYDYDETLTPGAEKKFDIHWSGYNSRTGNDTVNCVPSNNLKPAVETHSLVARLGTKRSQPVQIQIRSSAA
jgi:hypothetical protein